ncbi:hypothetical protein [Photobacterium sp. DNB22_13_2]
MASFNDKASITEYSKKHQKSVKLSKLTALVTFIFIFLILTPTNVLGFNSSNDESGTGGAVVVLVIIFVILGIINNVNNYNKKKEIEKEKLAEQVKERKIQSEIYFNSKEALKRSHQIVKLINEAHVTGDVIIQGNKAPVIINSTIIDSFNKVSKNDPELANALKILGGYIENSKDKAAGIIFDNLQNEVSKDERDNSTVKSYWDGLVAILPEIKELAGVATTIGALFL